MTKKVVIDGNLTDSYNTGPLAPGPDRNVPKVHIFLKNTHASNSLLFKINGYPNKEDGINVKTLMSEIILVAGGVVSETLTDPYDAILIQAKNATPGQTSSMKAIVVW